MFKKIIGWILFILALVFLAIYLIWDIFILPSVMGKKEKNKIKKVAARVKKTKSRIDDYINTHGRAKKL